MKIDAGKLDRVLVISNATMTRDAFSQDIETWAVFATVAGQRLELRFNQQAERRPGGPDKGPGPALVAMARYLIRYRTDLQIGQRVTVDGSDFYLTAIEEPDRRQSLVLTLAA